MYEKIQNIREELNSYFLERQNEIDLTLVSILSRKHLLLLGTWGIAKSQLCRAVASHIEGANYFEWLLTKFTTPEELFGVLDISKLEQGIYERKIEGKLPTSHFAFLDEIFKSNSAILNSLLTIINERIFYNNSTPVKVPLISLFSASNELPEEEEGLQALYDRLVLRTVVKPISDYSNLQKLLQLPEQYTPKTKISLQELQQIHQEVSKMPFDNAVEGLLIIKRKVQNEGIFISDRRLKQSVSILRAYAYLQGHSEVLSDDLAILRFVFWDNPEDMSKVAPIILEIANPFTKKANEYKDALDEMKINITKYNEVSPEVIEIYNKTLRAIRELKKLKKDAENLNKDTREIEKILEEYINFKNVTADKILNVAPITSSEN